ncbi:unnamed protein product [Schistocephalus solidus]|uniref:Transmembrane protein n=1 Tax=Schistocephalus solidus TaxID=70667 RepID=A0A183SKY3_SCHSO|nr:unnamed protein product [Schistocephalus solidus]
MLRKGVLHLLARSPYRPAFRRTQVPPPFPTSALDPTAVYIAADRRRFYRSIGIFCIFQASAWSVFTTYVMRKSEVNWKTLVADVDWFNRRIAQRLESWSPSALKKLFLCSPKRQEDVAAKPEEAATADSAVANANTRASAVIVTLSAENSANENEKKNSKDDKPLAQSLLSTAKDVSSSFRASLGISEDKKSIKITTGSLLPLLTGFMCVFTCFMGCVIPRRVVRHIGLVSRNTETSAVTNARQTNDPLLRVSTYGYFGLFPRVATFQVHLSQLRATAPYKEGNKFINVMITRRIFTFYVEKYEAQYLLPEFFDHLDQTASDSIQTKK